MQWESLGGHKESSNNSNNMVLKSAICRRPWWMMASSSSSASCYSTISRRLVWECYPTIVGHNSRSHGPAEIALFINHRRMMGTTSSTSTTIHDLDQTDTTSEEFIWTIPPASVAATADQHGPANAAAHWIRHRLELQQQEQQQQALSLNNNNNNLLSLWVQVVRWNLRLLAVDNESDDDGTQRRRQTLSAVRALGRAIPYFPFPWPVHQDLLEAVARWELEHPADALLELWPLQRKCPSLERSILEILLERCRYDQMVQLLTGLRTNNNFAYSDAQSSEWHLDSAVALHIWNSFQKQQQQQQQPGNVTISADMTVHADVLAMILQEAVMHAFSVVDLAQQTPSEVREWMETLSQIEALSDLDDNNGNDGVIDALSLSASDADSMETTFANFDEDDNDATTMDPMDMTNFGGKLPAGMAIMINPEDNTVTYFDLSDGSSSTTTAAKPIHSLPMEDIIYNQHAAVSQYHMPDVWHQVQAAIDNRNEQQHQAKEQQQLKFTPLYERRLLERMQKEEEDALDEP